MSVIALNMRKIILPVLLCFHMAVDAATVRHLRTQFMTNPMGIDRVPHFSWILESDQYGVGQTSYHIIVSMDASGKHPIWDSGVIRSSQSVAVAASGLQLKPSTRYYWSVQVTDNKGTKARSKEKAWFETGLMNSGWSGAEWISALRDKQKVASHLYADSLDGADMLRREFTLPKAVRWARLYSSGLGIYNVYLNGKRVGQMDDAGQMEYDELKPGFTDYLKTAFYTTHDVTPLLRQGSNAIGAEITAGWWLGPIAYGAFKAKSTAFIAKLLIRYDDGTEETIVTDPSAWQSSTEGPLRMGDIWNGEIYDARREDGCTKPDYNSADWLPAIQNEEFQGELVAFEGPAVKAVKHLERTAQKVYLYDGIDQTGSKYGVLHLVSTESGTAAITLKPGQRLVYDLGQNIAGWIQFKARGESGTHLHFRFSEMRNDDGSTERNNDGPGGSLYLINLRTARAALDYTLRGATEGETFHPTSTFFGFRYVEVTTDRTVTLSDLVGQVLTSVMDEQSHLETSHGAVNQLISNIMWSQRGNFISVPTDCPQRNERLGWTGDTQAYSMAGLYSAHSYTFYDKWMRDMRDSQERNGAYPYVAPNVWRGAAGAAAWSDAGIIVPWNVYLMYGDKGILERNMGSMERYMDFLASRSSKEWKYEGGIDLGDHLAFVPTDKRLIAVCYYAQDAWMMSQMEKALSTQKGDMRHQKSEMYAQLYDNIKAEFSRRFLGPDGTLRFKTQTALLLALRFGLLDGDAMKKAEQQLADAITANGERLNTGFVGTSVLNQTLSMYHLDDKAYNLLLQRECPSWLYSVDQGATTVWERWDSYTKERGFSPEHGMNSFNHYAYGAVAEWMYRFMAGIAPDEAEPGFHHFFLQPTPDLRAILPAGQERITRVDARYASMYGTIRSAWEQTDGQIIYEFTVPANTTATLLLPVSGETPTIVGGSGKQIKHVDNFVRHISPSSTLQPSFSNHNDHSSDRDRYELASGTYRFIVKQK